MAMKACKECGKPVSTTATACPHCGFKPTSFRALWIGGFLGVVVVIGIIQRESKEDHVAPSANVVPPSSAPAATPSPSKPQPKWEAIQSETRVSHSGNAFFSVRIEEKLTVEELSRIASILGEAVRGKGKKLTRVLFFLKGHEGDDQAWAVANFDPDLQVIINGMTKEAAMSIATAPLPPGEVIGVWTHDTHLGGTRFVIYKDVDGHHGQRLFKDGSGYTLKLTPKGSFPSGERFDEAERFGPDDPLVWLITPDLNLELDKVPRELVLTATRVTDK